MAISAARSVGRGGNTKGTVVSARRRLSPDERKEQILLAAIDLLANQGAQFNTRSLAAGLGISHPLLFKYFSSKDEIVDAVFQRVFLGRLSDDVLAIIEGGRSDPVRKWTEFYWAYTPKIFDATWVRIFISSALQKENISRRYFDRVVIPLVRRLAEDTEIHALGKAARPDSERRAVSLELAWSLHSSLFYTGLRRWVYGLPVPSEVSPVMAARVKAHFAGAAAALEDLADEPLGHAQVVAGKAR